MIVCVRFFAQLRVAAKMDNTRVELDQGASTRDLARKLADLKGESLRNLLFDARGNPSPGVIAFVNDEQIDWNSTDPLPEDAEVTFMSGISGG